MALLKNSKTILLGLSLMIVYVLGCANANDKTTAGNWSRGANLAATANTAAVGMNGAPGIPATITNGNANVLMALYSADGSPALPGSIYSVRMNMSDVQGNGAGQVVVTPQTAMTMLVTTSAGGPYQLTLPLISGNYNGYQIMLTYGDTLGSIIVNANVTQGHLYGTVTVGNLVVNGQNFSGQTLGQISY